MRTITGLEELKAAEGEVLGTSDWHEDTPGAYCPAQGAGGMIRS